MVRVSWMLVVLLAVSMVGCGDEGAEMSAETHSSADETNGTNMSNGTNTTVFRASDSNCDGVVDTCDRSVFDDKGNLTAHEEDLDCDGRLEEHFCNRYTYNEDGNPVQNQYDDKCDGKIDSCESYTYDGDGNLTNTLPDENCDATPDSYCSIYTYDAHGSLISDQVDEDCDGSPDERWCLVHTYSEGNLVNSQSDSDCDGAPNDGCVIYEYNADGGLASRREGWNCIDGVPREDCNVSVYEGGRLVREGGDVDCDGTVDFDCTTKTYDAIGNPTRYQYDWECDGNLDSCTTFTYE